jgi:hypothetical protein
MADDNDNDNDNGSTATADIDFDELSDDMKERLLSHPEVRRYVEYEETSIPQFVPMLRNLINDETETFDLFVQGIADRSGRVTEQTVRKVLNGAVEEYESVSS